MCDYFILAKPKDSNVVDDQNNDIIILKKNVYVLPLNNIQYYSERGLFEKSLIDMCKLFCQKDQNMLDIGAHSGTYTVSLANYTKHVHSFEPQKMTFYSLCGSIALSGLKNVTCHNCGLGSIEQAGTKKLNVISMDGGGSTLHNVDSAKILEQQDIKVKTLDSFFFTDISFIKIDVEDNELQVLMGGVETIRRCNYPKILFEMNQKNPQLIHFLLSCGYKIVAIHGYHNMFLATTDQKLI